MTDLYRRFAGLAAIATAAAGVVFTVTFAIAVRDGERWALWASSITLIVGGLVVNPAFYLAYGRALLTRARRETPVVADMRLRQDAE